MTTPPGVFAVVGDLVEDIIVWVEGPIEHATDSPARIVRTRGGSGANVAIAAGGVAGATGVRFIGRVGSDPLGSQLEKEMTDAGIDARLQHEGRTGTIVILVDASGERTMIPDRGAAAELGAIDPAALRGVGWLHLTIYGFETAVSTKALLDLAEIAHRNDIAVSIDASSVSVLRKLGFDEVHSLFDRLAPTVVFANEDEAEFLELLTRVPVAGRTVLVKRGADPVSIVTADGTVDVEIPPVDEVRDSTGAGDCFAAAFSIASMSGRTASEAVSDAAAAAAIVLKTPGATAVLA
jgi:sugar/nucleoside kinase (ribokinase family)